MNSLKIGKYKHYKGNFYLVLGIARHSETLEKLVVYKALYNSDEFGNNALWVRPLSNFVEKIQIDGEEIPRFRFVGENKNL